MAEKELADQLATDLGFSGADKEDFEKSEKLWAEDFRDFEIAIRASSVVSEKDLAVRINVRDCD